MTDSAWGKFTRQQLNVSGRQQLRLRLQVGEFIVAETARGCLTRDAVQTFTLAERNVECGFVVVCCVALRDWTRGRARALVATATQVGRPVQYEIIELIHLFARHREPMFAPFFVPIRRYAHDLVLLCTYRAKVIPVNFHCDIHERIVHRTWIELNNLFSQHQLGKNTILQHGISKRKTKSFIITYIVTSEGIILRSAILR